MDIRTHRAEVHHEHMPAQQNKQPCSTCTSLPTESVQACTLPRNALLCTSYIIYNLHTTCTQAMHMPCPMHTGNAQALPNICDTPSRAKLGNYMYLETPHFARLETVAHSRSKRCAAYLEVHGNKALQLYFLHLLHVWWMWLTLMRSLLARD